MIFPHKFLPRQELVAITDENGRRYKTPIGDLPSVTTVIGQSMDKTGLDRWRESIGDEEADGIVNQARVRGRELHDLAENYVRNNPNYADEAMPINLDTFRQVKALLDKNLETVYGIELPLWSKVLRTAGQADMIGKWQGKNAIIDYKTSLKPKTEERCLGYLLQGTTYACMMYERYKMIIPLVVIILTIDHELRPVVYSVSSDKYYDQVYDIFVERRQHEIIQKAFA